MFLIGRFVLAREVVTAKLEIRAVFIDLAVTVTIALLTSLLAMIRPAVSVLFLLLVSAFYIAIMEAVAYLDEALGAFFQRLDEGRVWVPTVPSTTVRERIGGMSFLKMMKSSSAEGKAGCCRAASTSIFPEVLL